MKIRSQLSLASSIVGSVFLTTMWIVYYQTQTVELSRQQSELLESEVVATNNLKAALGSEIVEAYEQLILAKNNEGLLEAKSMVRNSLRIIRMLDEEKKRRGEKDVRQDFAFNKLQEICNRFEKEIDHSINLYAVGRKAEGEIVLRNVSEDVFRKEFLKNIQVRMETEDDYYRMIGKQLKGTISLLKVTVIFLFGFSTMVVAYLIHHLAGSLGDRLIVLVKATKTVKDGDLDNRVEISGQDELKDLAEAFNAMVTSLKTARQTLIDQQLQIVATSKMSALGQMAGGIAHEINNPLAVIAAEASQLQTLNEMGKLDKNRTHSVSERILNTTERIAKIIKGLRTFARDGEGDPFVATPADRVMKETLEYCYARFKNNDVELRIEEPLSNAPVDCRPVQMSQVLLNLLNNAFDAVKNQEKAWVSVGVKESLDTVEFQITDSGKGIPPEIAGKILEPFFTTKKAGEGTGIGLSISVGIMKAHEGELYVDPLCANTRFTVRLPKKHLIPEKKAA